MKRYLLAILLTVLLFALAVFAPIFVQWYGQQTGIEFPFAIAFVSFIAGIGLLALCLFSWIAAIKDKDIKDIF